MQMERQGLNQHERDKVRNYRPLISIADAGGGRPSFGYGGNIIDHATVDGKTTLCGREVLTDLAETSFLEDSTNPCKRCLKKAGER